MNFLTKIANWTKWVLDMHELKKKNPLKYRKTMFIHSHKGGFSDDLPRQHFSHLNTFFTFKLHDKRWWMQSISPYHLSGRGDPSPWLIGMAVVRGENLALIGQHYSEETQTAHNSVLSLLFCTELQWKPTCWKPYTHNHTHLYKSMAVHVESS